MQPETVSRWERHKRSIGRATYAIIRQLLTDRLRGTSEMADYLRSLRKPAGCPNR